jgi:glycosyltransferase involved in cell wall biosynthesis
MIAAARPGESIIISTPSPESSDITALARQAGIERIHMLAWRDLDDVEAGGSEMYAAKIASIWAEAGIEVVMRTSYAQGQPPEADRNGYHVVRRSGRYSVFPITIAQGMMQKHRPGDAVVEFWNGVPYLTPIWFRGPRLVIIHHVHRTMWSMVVSPKLAKMGRLLEGRLAPPFYRTTPLVTPSNSSRDELITLLGMPAKNITVAPPGIDAMFNSDGDAKSEHPLIVTVGRLMPPKRFDEMIRIAHEVRKDHPDLELVVVGDGYERPKLQQLVHDLDAHDWVRLAGHVSDDELVWLYQRAWVVASASTAEGWGMTITEAAACGTPAVATRIAGHRDSVAEDASGLLASSSREMVAKLRAMVSDRELRLRLSEGARKHAAEFTWEACAINTFAPLARHALRRRGHHGGISRP